MRSGECRLLGQGLNTVTLTKFKAPSAKLRRLKTLIATIPASWAASSYAGYNFITDAESPSASEIAVHGKKSGGLLGYFVPAAGSEAETLVKAIAKLD